MLHLRATPRLGGLPILLLCAIIMVSMAIYSTFTFYKRCPSTKNVNSVLIKSSKVLEYQDPSTHVGRKIEYDENIPILFIGGMPRSGTTLLRVMLDTHPDIRCGGETRVIPRLLNLRQMWMNSRYEYKRLSEAGIGEDVVDKAVSAFMLEIIVRHGSWAKVLCNKDPFTLKSAVYIKSLFPNAKFLLMIRDGRAVAHSIYSRKVTISGFNITDYRSIISKWNAAVETMYAQCKQLGSDCLAVYYEKLVLQPEETLRGIMKFVRLPWNESLLHHYQYIDTKEVHLSKLERSTDQVVKPVNTETLSTWVGEIPEDVIYDMASIAPMLQVLGYDPNANPPNYGNPDKHVIENMRSLAANKEKWKDKEMQLIKQRESLRNDLVAKKSPSRLEAVPLSSSSSSALLSIGSVSSSSSSIS